MGQRIPLKVMLGAGSSCSPALMTAPCFSLEAITPLSSVAILRPLSWVIESKLRKCTGYFCSITDCRALKPKIIQKGIKWKAKHLGHVEVKLSSNSQRRNQNLNWVLRIHMSEMMTWSLSHTWQSHALNEWMNEWEQMSLTFGPEVGRKTTGELSRK